MKNLPATGPQEYLHAGNWLTAFYLAAICRENDRVNQLAPLAIACMAYDADMPIEAESARLPKYLVQHSWVGEFTT
ncbi:MULTISPECIES: hypothetical protein [unclassified Streptomyces]|uniref:hypothetical protein n=1 Tax=unclassified Streptomyces TaxID=2593676 RepID=UPI002DDC7E34|nr:hypothetical protein [Streptomyces sp. NBC_01294]WRZ57928.1 immunity 49 family protein [Streptomyces sp. NBC_01294]